MPDIYCLRCYMTIDSKEKYEEHMRLNPPCEMQDTAGAPEGFDKGQERELRSRKVAYEHRTDEEKWRQVYRILFPHDAHVDAISPCKLTATSTGLRKVKKCGGLTIRRLRPVSYTHLTLPTKRIV